MNMGLPSELDHLFVEIADLGSRKILHDYHVKDTASGDAMLLRILPEELATDTRAQEDFRAFFSSYQAINSQDVASGKGQCC